MTISRREFLESSARLLVATRFVAPISFPLDTAAPKRVLVLGAGAAGLCAAYELDRAGHEVLVFEAKAIPGGRIHTLRAPFADGLYAEAGAMYVPEAHNLTLHYIREFDLPLVELTPRTDLGAIVHVTGARIEIGTNRTVRWPVPLRNDEADQGIGALQRRYYYTPAGRIAGLDAPDWPHPSHLEYDGISLAELWRRQGASEAAIQIMRLRFWDGVGDGIESFSALSALRDSGTWAASTKYYRIRGGSDLLPGAFANRLAGKIHYGSPIVAIRHDDQGVEVTLETRFGRRQVRGDLLVCTLPFPVLARIPVTPPFPAKRRKAIEEIRSTSVTRVYVQCRERFWEAEGQDGSAVTDLPIQSVFHATQGQPGVRGILEAMVTGPSARRLAALSPEQRLDDVIREMVKVHPRLPDHVEGGASYSWDNDPWALGDFAYFKPGQITEYFPAIQQPEGRIHFAGDHIAGIPGWIQGAFLSAQTVARQIGQLP
jgi:monoamine oxidase